MVFYEHDQLEQWFSIFFISRHSELGNKMIEAHHQYLRNYLDYLKE